MMRVIGQALGLAGRLGGLILRLVWRSRRASAIFERTLREVGVPPEGAARLRAIYRAPVDSLGALVLKR